MNVFAIDARRKIRCYDIDGKIHSITSQKIDNAEACKAMQLLEKNYKYTSVFIQIKPNTSDYAQQLDGDSPYYHNIQELVQSMNREYSCNAKEGISDTDQGSNKAIYNSKTIVSDKCLVLRKDYTLPNPTNPVGGVEVVKSKNCPNRTVARNLSAEYKICILQNNVQNTNPAVSPAATK